MKSLLVFALMVFSLSAMACPNITGTFFDADSETTKTITQDACLTSTWSEEGDVTTLYADGVERVLQQEGSMTAFAKVSFTTTELVIDIRMDYGGHNDFDLPVRWITSYRIDKYNNLVERIEPFKADGSQGATEYVTFRRVK